MTTRTFFCELCKSSITQEAIDDTIEEGMAAAMEHFRVVHPETFQTIERWPDGSPVVVDDSLEPEDFMDGDQ